MPEVKDTPAIILAPMDSITDAPMRKFMHRLNGGALTHCVTEFLRVTKSPGSEKEILRLMPELAGPRDFPVHLQLLGSNPENLLATALSAVGLGAQVIDLNFGCPAPTVNRHGGGASLLKTPERIFEIVHTLREGLPKAVKLSAKLRLGWEHPEEILTLAPGVEAAGADWLTIHARTKLQNYDPPAHWEWIARVRERVSLPVVANGDIWTLDDFRECRRITGCTQFMLGRSLLARPTLPQELAAELGIEFKAKPQPSWPVLFRDFAEDCARYGDDEYTTLSRIKKWCRYAQAADCGPANFSRAKKYDRLAEFLEVLSV